MRAGFGGYVNYIFRDTLSLSLSPAAKVVRVHQVLLSQLPIEAWGACEEGIGRVVG